MLVEIAIGDAYGAGFEYAPERFVRDRNDLSAYVRHDRHTIAPGSYTDDTQMSIAVAEAMLSGERWKPKLLARHFIDAFKRDPREGYARRFHGFLQTVTDADDFIARIRNDSEKSGAAMRACPVGLFPTVGTVIDRATVQAAVTHDTPLGIGAAVAAALATHYFLYRIGPKAELGEFLAAHVPGPWAADWVGPVGEKGVESVRAAVTAIRRSDRMTDVLRTSIAYTGDVDTVAAVALGAAAGCAEIEQDLPRHLYDGLENGPFGRDYLADLGRRLFHEFAESQ